MQSAKWYLNRLSLMSGGELLWRAGQTIKGRLARLSPTPPGIPPRIADAQLSAWPAPRSVHAHRQAYLIAADRILAGEVNLFGDWRSLKEFPDVWNTDPESRITAPMTPGHRLDYRDPARVGSARNVWEVNRHFQLVAVAQAWALSGEPKYRAAALGMIESWLQACPYPLGLNWVSALEHGIRLLNWYIAARVLQSPSTPESLSCTWLDSIYRHCDFIWTHQSRYSSANNHLIGEMAGLYVACCAWPCWEQSKRWRKDAKRILEREAQTQVHADGVSREQTVGYQAFVLQFLILAGLVGESVGDPFSAAYWQRVQAMIAFLRAIADASGALPDFGDSDEGMAYLLAPDARARRFQDMCDIDAAFRDGPHAQQWDAMSMASWLMEAFPRPRHYPAEAAAQRRSFPSGGYFVLARDAGTASEVKLVADAAPLGYLSIAAHGHADCLSFTLSLAGEQVLVDPGTYCYHSDALWRDHFRGTSAHNTVRVDGLDQSQIAGPFMWMHKAVPHVETVVLDAPIQRLRASHDGYHRLPDRVRHTREIVFDTATDRLEVRDVLGCAGAHTTERFWHFAEHCDVQRVDPRTVQVTARRTRLTLRCQEDSQIEIYRGSQAPRAGWISRRFGQLEPATTVVMQNRIAGDSTLVASVSWEMPRVV